MALNAYLRMKGQKTGEVKGSVTQKGRADSMMVIAYEHEILTPRDVASGLPTGKRQHKPLMILKEIDKASPLLYGILVNNENIPTWKLEFWTPQQKAAVGTGSEVQYYTIELVNANICQIEQFMLNNKNPDLTKYAPSEKVFFTYQKITWTWVDGGITTEDDWEAPVV